MYNKTPNIAFLTNYRSCFGNICMDKIHKYHVNTDIYIISNNPYQLQRKDKPFLRKIKNKLLLRKKKTDRSYLEYHDRTIDYAEALNRDFKIIQHIDIDLFKRILNKKPEAIVLGDAPIIPKECVAFAKRHNIPIFNMHAAELPEYRGNYATYAMVRDGLPLCMTYHCIDESIDEGQIVDKYYLDPEVVCNEDTFFSLERKLYVNGIDTFFKNIHTYINAYHNKNLIQPSKKYPLVSISIDDKNSIKRNFSNYLQKAYKQETQYYSLEVGSQYNVNINDFEDDETACRLNLCFENDLDPKLKKFGLFHNQASHIYTDSKIDKFNKKQMYLPGGKTWSVVLSHDVDIIPANFDHVKKIFEIENKFNVTSTFLLAALESLDKRHEHDPTYILDDTMTKELIYYIVANNHEIGLHGSLDSYENLQLLEEEKNRLESFIGMEIKSIRQHFLNFDRAITPDIQEKNGFIIDSTLGFPSDLGLRSSMSKPYFLYDYENESNHKLLTLPYLIMDQNIFWNESLEDASYSQRLKYLIDKVEYAKKYQSVVVLDWHLHTIELNEWWDVYHDILEHLKKDETCAIMNMEQFYYAYMALNRV